MATALFFGPVGDVAGADELELPDGCDTVAEAFDWLCGKAPRLEAQRDRLRFAVNGQFAPFDQMLFPDDELSILSPVSGG